jgi:hypothetical protein
MKFALKQIELMSLVNDNRSRSLEYMKEQKKAIFKKDNDERIEKHEKVIEK